MLTVEKAIEQVLEYVYQQSEGHCALCGAKDYPVKGDKQGYENVKPEDAEEWRIDHEDNCPVSILGNQKEIVVEVLGGVAHCDDPRVKIIDHDNH